MYHYLVVHVPSGKIGRGVSVAQALEQALGHKEHMKFTASQPRSGFLWGKYDLRTLGSTAVARRTVQPIKNMYEVCPVYMSAKDNTLLMTVYRTTNPSILLQLPDVSHTTTQGSTASTKNKSKGKCSRA